MSHAALNVLVGLAHIAGIAGILVPILPGTVVIVVALVVWAILVGGVAWAFAGGALLVLGLGQLLKYLVPGRSLAAAGVPSRSLLIGGLAAIAGFLLIPVVGVVVGFVTGIYVAEHARLRDWEQARSSTLLALRATGIAVLIELTAALVSTVVWVTGVAVTA